ncbi:protein FAR1-RELATED SEQUENCE 5-like [Rhododendron vialii]|uniref:protein FAR1-RELATED SEQUENCE 5-like n=1 Tax=Rhododendron vialii TaxID=182163 RepID=UPI00265E2984|nr:protein FAR1-RELATED SEQUENCE 5-like [Rhododendron vialii]
MVRRPIRRREAKPPVGTRTHVSIEEDSKLCQLGYHLSGTPQRKIRDGTIDDYNVSISDSWSFENDVRSEESIFESREDMLAWARSVGLKYGIVVVILNSAKLKGGKLPKYILGCERGGKYEPPRYLIEGQSLQRNTRTRKCNCPFQLRGIPQHPYGNRWGLEVISGVHNHEIAKYIEGHKYPSRLKPIEKQFVVDMANSTAPREILSILKQKDPSNTTGIKSVYNTIFANKTAKLDGLTPTQFVIRQLLEQDYLHQFITNPDTNEITDIIWVHPMSLELFVNFPSVLIIDATYKTNEYRKPLLEVVGITSTWRTYSLMFAYLSNEREETLTWALDNLKNWMLQKGASMPLVFVSDRDLALMNAIEACFPLHVTSCVFGT